MHLKFRNCMLRKVEAHWPLSSSHFRGLACGRSPGSCSMQMVTTEQRNDPHATRPRSQAMEGYTSAMFCNVMLPQHSLMATSDVEKHRAPMVQWTVIASLDVLRFASGKIICKLYQFFSASPIARDELQVSAHISEYPK